MLLKIVILSLILSMTGWFKAPLTEPIFLDEVSWVNHSYVYSWRKDKNWENFDQAKNIPSPIFSSPYFLLFDQPHLVRYIYGFVLDLNQIELWQNGQQEKNYQLFVEQKLGGKIAIEDEIAPIIFSSETVRAIEICRYLSTSFAIAFFILFFLFLSKKFSLIPASIAMLILASNPTIYNNFRFATADSILNFFTILVVILLDKFFNERESDSKTQYLYFFFSAIFTALAASSKINAWILIPIFIIFNLSLKQKNPIKKTLIWLTIFLATYIYLQPELWSEILIGFYKFFSLRLRQQQRFILAFNKMNLLDYHLWIMQLFLKSKSQLMYFLKIFLLISSIINFFKRKKNINKTKLLALAIVWLFCFFYARISFDRYAIWPMILIDIFIAKEWQLICAACKKHFF